MLQAWDEFVTCTENRNACRSGAVAHSYLLHLYAKWSQRIC